jgi:hypothetical protein
MPPYPADLCMGQTTQGGPAMNDATRPSAYPEQIVTPRTRAAIAAAEALAWELIPRVIELSYVAGEAHAMFHAEMRGTDDDIFRLVGHFSGYARLRDVLDLVGGFAATAADEGSVSRDDRTRRLARKLSAPDAPVDVVELMAEWADQVGSDDWPAR